MNNLLQFKSEPVCNYHQSFIQYCFNSVLLYVSLFHTRKYDAWIKKAWIFAQSTLKSTLKQTQALKKPHKYAVFLTDGAAWQN